MIEPIYVAALVAAVALYIAVLLSARAANREQARQFKAMEEMPEDQKELRILRQYMHMILPGLYRWRAHYAEDWRHPVEELDLYVDDGLRKLVIVAYWKDRTVHKSYLSAAELTAESPGWFDTFKARMDEVCPRSYFDDEIVVAYDDSFRTTTY